MPPAQTASEEADALFHTHAVETNALSDAYYSARRELVDQAIAMQTETCAKIARLDTLYNEACTEASNDYWEARRRVLQGGG